LNRIEPTIEKQQSTDQAAYRKGYSTDDHLFVFAQLHEKTLEHRLDYWIAAIDFRKAFDSIEHDSLWGALLDQGVETQYVSLLKKLYIGQSARVCTDKLSKQFEIGRGTKQGDPLSAALFSALLEGIMRKCKASWASHKCGLQMGVGDSSRLTNLRFADDVLLIARTKKQLTTIQKKQRF
jgi:hypothetical protein